MAAVHKAIIPIVGLRCGDNLALERHLGRIPGVLRVYVNPATEMARRGFPTGADFQYLLVGSPTLLELEEERVMRFLSARWGLIQFDSSTEQIKITGVVDDAREFVPGSRSVRLTRQTIGPMPWSAWISSSDAARSRSIPPK